jgi:hypothetical protein
MVPILGTFIVKCYKSTILWGSDSHIVVWGNAFTLC